MKGDFTRSTHDPKKGYSSVRMQQGRVQTDADWNEQVEIGTRLRRQGFSDIIGRCGAPKDEHGGGFKVEIAAGGNDLAVTGGRMWVDGILCESQPPEGQTSTRLTQQWDFPGYQTPTQPGRYLIYLDVWEQHVTALEDEDIRETALGGPDTATRTRTVSQVKWVRVPDGSECDDVIPAYAAATATPDGRMRARTRPGGAGGPCVVPEAAGYTRLENQLYRVEVHRGGELGGAGPQPTFKWSRENGSVVTRWLGSSGQDVTLESLGRDRLLGFTETRWVELTDDRDELNGTHGGLFEVSAVGDDSLTLSAAPGAPGPANRSPKVRRWEMTGAGGAIPIVTAPDDGDNSWTVLENGVQSDFAPGTYRTGDWWWIPARAFVGENAGEIEWPGAGGGPAALLPEGVDHYYCRLALVSFAGGSWVGTPQDCRPTFCPLTELETGEGCCTVVLEPGVDQLQGAIDSLPPAGGCICLKAGIHQITQTVTLNRSNITLHGESAGAVVRSSTALPMLRTGAPTSQYFEGVQVMGIEFRFEPPAGAGQQLPPLPIIDLESTDGALLAGCHIAALEPLPITGVRIGRSIDLRIEENHVENAWIGVWLDTDSTHVAIRRCLLRIQTQDNKDSGFAGVLIDDAYGPCFVEENQINGFWLGVRIDGAPLGQPPMSKGHGSLVAGNRIGRSADLEDQGIRIFAIDVAGHECVVRDNRIGCGSPHHGGIRISGRRGRVLNNLLWGPQEAEDETYALGILLGIEDEDSGGHGDGGVVRGNQLFNTFDGIWIHGADAAEVRGNQFSSDFQAARMGIVVSASEGTVVADNRLRDTLWGLLVHNGHGNQLQNNHLEDGYSAINAGVERALTVSGNRVTDHGGPGFFGLSLDGQTTLAGNRFASCGYAPGPLAAITVFALSGDLAGEFNLRDCEVLDTGISADGETAVTQPAWGAFVWAFGCSVRGNRFAYSNAAPLGLVLDHRALVLLGPPYYHFEASSIDLGTAEVEGNWFMGPGPQALVSLIRIPLSDTFGFGFNRVIFSDNVCQHIASPVLTPGREISFSRTVLLAARRSTTQGNQVASFPVASSFDFDNTGRTVFLGNFIEGPVINWTPFPSNFNDFNQSG